jgi:hypothetical protein
VNRVFSIAIVAALITGCHFVGGGRSSDRSAIQEAQAKSFAGANPIWLSLTSQKDLFRRVRDRAYGYCLRAGVVDKKCASEQDEAVQSSVGAIDVAAAQAAMKNKDSLGRKERYVATNPDVARSVVSSCWALYKEHGAADARVLSVCLGNLTDYSPLAPLPVP